ncbi:MAG: hypothetical protein H6700_07000 [Myxococcales bacterium]|nr:hypothetical protein [Myxococcales bacterium]MCB9520572.1 hypothetical protein [Myxococcales bacterium]MCB9531495.1 hypothetical protein [Myxococcales bacterium]
MRLCCLTVVLLLCACGTVHDECPEECVGPDEMCVDGECVASGRDVGDLGTGADDAAETSPDVDAVDIADAADDADDADDSADSDVHETSGDPPTDDPEVVDGDPDVDDATPDDADSADDADSSGDADAGDTAAPGDFRLVVLDPTDRATFAAGAPVAFEALASLAPEVDATTYVARWVSDIDGELFVGNLDADGLTHFETTTLSTAAHHVSVTVTSSDDESASAEVAVGVCGWTDAATFDTDLPSGEWRTYNNATRDPRGWLEMTGAARDRRGAIANIARPVAAGDVQLRFRVATGQCDTIGPCPSTGQPGADGFALSVFEASDVPELEGIIAAAARGGGLGYGIAGGWGTWTGDPVAAFHIEFDTWHNVYNGTNEFHTDPTSENHIAITLDGNPGDHRLWAEAPTLEDNEWHDIVVSVRGSRVRVSMDDAVVIDDIIDGLTFKGGYVVFTGTTGYYYNFHRFDELQVVEDCRFE